MQVLQEDILPALEKLRKEKGQYMEWQTADAKLGHLKRFCAAYRYTEAQRSDLNTTHGLAKPSD